MPQRSQLDDRNFKTNMGSRNGFLSALLASSKLIGPNYLSHDEKFLTSLREFFLH